MSFVYCRSSSLSDMLHSFKCFSLCSLNFLFFSNISVWTLPHRQTGTLWSLTWSAPYFSISLRLASSVVVSMTCISQKLSQPERVSVPTPFLTKTLMHVAVVVKDTWACDVLWIIFCHCADALSCCLCCCDFLCRWKFSVLCGQFFFIFPASLLFYQPFYRHIVVAIKRFFLD